jgi:hypothetical protein
MDKKKYDIPAKTRVLECFQKTHPYCNIFPVLVGPEQYPNIICQNSSLKPTQTEIDPRVNVPLYKVGKDQPSKSIP